jgi:hypothetical protein
VYQTMKLRMSRQEDNPGPGNKPHKHTRAS